MKLYSDTKGDIRYKGDNRYHGDTWWILTASAGKHCMLYQSVSFPMIIAMLPDKLYVSLASHYIWEISIIFSQRFMFYYIQEPTCKNAAQQMCCGACAGSWFTFSFGHDFFICFFILESSSTKSHLPSKVVFHKSSSSTKGRLPPKVVFHWISSSIEGHLPPKVVFHQRSSSTEGRLPPKVAFLLKVIFKWRLYSTNGSLPPKVVFHLP